jgi:hypothetical protein
MKRRWPWIAALFLLTLLVHSRAGKGEFLFFDDARFVVRNPSIEEVGNPLRFFTDLETPASPDAPTRDIYRPIRTLSYAVISEGWGRESAGPFHALAILLHAATTALLALLLLSAGLHLWPALAGACFWGVHPVSVEVTAWVCSLGDAWCGLFSLLSVFWYAKDRPILASLAFVLALFSKEHALVLPGIWVAWDFFLRPERLRGSVVRAILPGLAIIVAFLLFRHSLDAKMSQLDEPLGGSHLKAALTMLKGLGLYAWTILIPVQSTFQRRIEVPASPLDVSVLAGLAILAALLFGLFRGPRRTRLASAWFLLALIPASNLIVTLKIPTADRFLYLPLMGASFAVGEICQRLKRPVAYAVPALLVLLGVLTSIRIGDFRNDEALLKTWERVNPKDPKLIWAQAAGKARRAVLTMDRAGLAQSRALVAEALHHYELFVRNAAPEETTQIWMEMGELQLKWGTTLQRLGLEEESLDALRASRNSFRAAHALQVQGLGRVIPEEVERAAAMAASLSLRLALPEKSKTFGDDVKTGLAMLEFLEAEFGHDVEMQRAQLWFLTARQRRYEPARVRPILRSVLETLDKLAREGRPNPYLRAQALLVLSILKDRPIDRPGLDEAYALFLEASRQSRQVRLQALFHAAQTRRIVGKTFDEPREVDRARVILDRIPKVAAEERLRITLRLQRLIEVEKSQCASR